MGQVWLAEDPKLRFRVALRLPRRDEWDSHLVHEVHLAAKLKHLGIVAVSGVGEEHGQL